VCQVSLLHVLDAGAGASACGASPGSNGDVMARAIAQARAESWTPRAPRRAQPPASLMGQTGSHNADGAWPSDVAGAAEDAASEPGSGAGPAEPEADDPIFDKLAGELGLDTMLRLTRINFNVLETHAVKERSECPYPRRLEPNDVRGQLDTLARGDGTARRSLGWLGLGFAQPGPWFGEALGRASTLIWHAWLFRSAAMSRAAGPTRPSRMTRRTCGGMAPSLMCSTRLAPPGGDGFWRLAWRRPRLQ
jgi:hypothetical protein